MASTSFDIDVNANAGSVEPAAAALARLTDRLTSASAASAAAAEALKAGSSSYAAAEVAADRAAKALEKVNLAATAQAGKLQAALDVGDVGGAERAARKLQDLTARQREAAAVAEQTKAALATEAASLDKLRTAADAAAKEVDDLKKAQGNAKKAADATAKLKEAASGSGKINEMAEAFGKLGGPVGALGQRALGAGEGLKKLFASMGTVVGASAAVVIAIAAVATILVAGTAAILKFAISAADAGRSAELLAQGIEGTVAGGTALNARINDLSKRLPQSRDELRNMAADLAKTGLKGDALANALEDAATKAAKVKWGPDFAKQTNSLDKLSQRFGDNLRDIFGGLKIDGLLEGLSKLVGLFDASNTSGKAIKVLFESLFQPLIDGLVALAPKIVSAFIQFEIWVYKALIAIKPFGSTFLFIAKVVGTGAAVIGAVLAIALGVILAVAAASALLVTGLIWLGSKFFEVASGVVAFVASLVGGAGGAVDFIREKIAAVIEFLSGLSLGDIGMQLIQGLANGLLGAGPAVLQAITGVVGGAIDAAKGLLGIASPSTVFAEIGMNTGAGMTQGVEGATSAVQGSLEAMVSPPVAEANAGAAGPGGGGGGSADLSGATFHFYGVKDGDDAEARFEGVMTRILEGDAAQLGQEIPA